MNSKTVIATTYITPVGLGDTLAAVAAHGSRNIAADLEKATRSTTLAGSQPLIIMLAIILRKNKNKKQGGILL